MEIVTDLKIDKEKSKRFSIVDIIPHACYGNIFNIVEAIKLNKLNLAKDLEVAYGYLGNPKVRMFRHCFLVDKESVIDPTCVNDVGGIWDNYHIFKKYNFAEYDKVITEFRKKNGASASPLLWGMIAEERLYCDYAIKNKIYIDQWSYDHFLKQYDQEKKVISVNDEFAEYLYQHATTVGKELRSGEIEQFKDGTMLWLETKEPMPILTYKEGSSIKHAVSRKQLCLLSEIGSLYIAKELCQAVYLCLDLLANTLM